MIKQKFFWPLSVILVIGVLAILKYSSRDVELSPIYKTSSMNQLHLKHKEGGNLKWELFADKAIFPTGEKKVFLGSVDITIKNSPDIFITGGSGVYELLDEVVTLNRPVEFNMQNTKLTTNSMKMKNKTEIITTDDPVTYSGSNFLVEGTGMIAKVKQQEVKILNNVKAIFYR